MWLKRRRRAFSDTLGAALAGSNAQGSKQVVSLIRDWGGSREASVINYAGKLPLPNAVFANGVMARAVDLDDLHEKATLHSSATIVPVALAVSEYHKPITGKEFLTAVVLGNDLTSRLSLASRNSPAVTGISYSYTHRTFGGAAVASRLLGLDEAQMRHAMGIAYSQGVGNLLSLHGSSINCQVQ